MAKTSRLRSRAESSPPLKRSQRWQRRKHRIFVTGLSAGGAMTSVMLASYPEVFAAGAIIAGLPYGVATNPSEAATRMFQSPARPASELGDLIRNASIITVPGQKFQCGTAARIARSIPPMLTKSLSNGSTCISCLRHQCRRAPSTGIRIRSGGMQIAKRSWNPIPSMRIRCA